MKKLNLLLVLFFLVNTLSAQITATDSLKPYKIAIFAPLYLDSAFKGNAFKYGKSFPKFSHAGYEFVQGALIALDSLPLPKGSIQAFVYDSKAETQNIPWLIANNVLADIDLIVGSVKDAELTKLASFSKSKNIPFVSATSPNDGGTVKNPFFMMLNATLRGHCENSYSYLIQKHGTDKIYLCRKKGAQEDKIAEYFKSINEQDGSALLNIETLNFEDDFTSLQSKLDSNRTSVFIGGSLNETFANGLGKTISEFAGTYPSELIGMPNWETFEELKKPMMKDLPILMTASYYNPKTDMYSKKVTNAYWKKFKGSPSDMVYKGFEAVYVFTTLIYKYPNDFNSHLNEKDFKLYSEFNFKPIYLKEQQMPDYFENKHLFLIKLLNGKLSRVL
jgi:ABC-type branched-subunit amino acid transport system substrate-binding protein